ncbi:MAG: winged helix-turn-helix transcriptional regulator [Candidatus Omnitrophica bacterium]|nr:winged helix-turn-helix transcriptional regulator [Candidatus Omnitrophota bacterium]
MTQNTYRDMHLLDELSRSPDSSQREISKRIGVALGMTNLMLRRLVKKGYVKIIGTKSNRLRYLITPQGILEKSRLTYEFIEYSLQLYSRVRHSLREQLALVAQEGQRRILLSGTGELAEIAFLTIHEMKLELIGVVEEPLRRERFLGQPVQGIETVMTAAYDYIIEASRPWGDTTGVERLLKLGVSPARIISLAHPVMTTPQAVEVAAHEVA